MTTNVGIVPFAIYAGSLKIIFVKVVVREEPLIGRHFMVMMVLILFLITSHFA